MLWHSLVCNVPLKLQAYLGGFPLRLHPLKTRTLQKAGATGILALATFVLGSATLPSPTAFAQATNTAGTIQGTVSDSSGAAVPDARIILSQASTGFQRTLTSSGSGYYSVGSIAPGSYTLHAEATGFAPSDTTITVNVGVVSTGNIKLGVSGSLQQVEVQASAVNVDTQQTQIAGILSQQQIQALPVNGRNFLDLAQLQPGVQIQDGTNFDPTKNGFMSISFGGRFGRTARIALDGLDISDENVGTTTQNLSEEAIQEFQVAQSNLDISTSITSSGSVNIVSRTGTNKIHGDARWLFRDKRAGGADFPGGQDNYLQRNDVAGGVGGPIIPDKAFYFLSGENYTQHLDAPVDLIGTPFQPLSGSYNAPYKELDLLGRFDFNLPHGAHAFIRGAYFNNKDTGGFGGGNNYSPYLNVDNVPNVGGGLDFLTGNFSHSFRVGYFKFFNEITDATAVTQDPLFNKTPGVNLTVTGTPYSSGTNLLAPQQTVQSNKQFKYDGSWTKGNHTIRYGAGINHLQGGGFASFFGLEPNVTLDVTSYAGDTNALFPGLASNPQNYIVNSNASNNQGIILGNGQGFNTEFAKFGYPGGGQEDWRVTAYLGDQWKLTPRINLNYGVRYIRDTGRNDSDLPAIPALDAVAPGLGNKIHQPNANFGPQAGIAWDVTGKGNTVVRAGAGIYYENNVWNNVLFDRPARLTNGLFFGDTTVCPSTSVSLPDGSSLTTIDGTPNGVPIASICGAQLGSVTSQIATLAKTYQAAVKAIGPSSNGNYILNTMAVGGGVNGDTLFLPQYKTPESYQMNIGVQQALGRDTVVTVDYVRNIGQNFILGIDENHAGDVKNYNATAAQAAVAATVAACGVGSVDAAIAACPGLHATGGAVIGDFASNGLDSINQSNGGGPSSNFAFQGNNPSFGQMEFLTPGGRSVYNALEVTVNKRARNVFRGVSSMDLTAAYTYSRFGATGTNALGSGSSGGDQDFGAAAINMRNPSQFFGPSSLDRRNQFSLGLSTQLIKGFTFDTIAHLYSSLPLTLSVPGTGSGSIFSSDFNGDGTVADLLPGTNVGAFMRTTGPKSINTLINAYNNNYVNKLTPAGAAVVNSGVLTNAEMVALGGVPQVITPAPVNQVGNDILRIWDVGAGYAFKIGESLSLQPSVHAFNVLNAANFDGPGTIGSTRQTGVLTGSPGSANNTTYATQEPYRVGLGTGVYGFGAPRQLEFSMKLVF